MTNHLNDLTRTENVRSHRIVPSFSVSGAVVAFTALELFDALWLLHVDKTVSVYETGFVYVFIKIAFDNELS